ncbi:hypothetical protein [Paenibacillus mucilaginosus]|uniref:YabN n=1 Tax=Paenibacillus mucilaginosus (strain KNP414) TaxID=1036673 RepID=F8FCJ1_PAEMK|nr:hypothetical protein [Paenibacillus mucilaginosus]AEI46082.1 YabN [Paenibacillus mucilaginosus KNP414]
MSMSPQAQLTVVGLGTGDENQLTLGVWRKLEAASGRGDAIFLRTKEHPMVSMLDHHNIRYETLPGSGRSLAGVWISDVRAVRPIHYP